MCDVQYTLLSNGFYLLGDGSEEIGNVFSGKLTCNQTQLIVPRSYKGKEIREIGKNAMRDLSLTSLTILAPITIVHENVNKKSPTCTVHCPTHNRDNRNIQHLSF